MCIALPDSVVVAIWWWTCVLYFPVMTWFVPVLIYVPRLLKLLKHLEWVKQYVFSFSLTEIMLLKIGTMFRVAQCNTYKFQDVKVLYNIVWCISVSIINIMDQVHMYVFLKLVHWSLEGNKSPFNMLTIFGELDIQHQVMLQAFPGWFVDHWICKLMLI